MTAAARSTAPATAGGSPPVDLPTAPGRLGEALDPAAFARYLDGLQRWRADRRTQLDALDAAALASPTGGAATSDIVLAMTVWQAVTDRCTALDAIWSGGRVGQVERERLSGLVWGRVEGFSVSLPEACRLVDALIASLRVRLGLDLSGAELTSRIRALRAQLERIREQVDLEPAGDGQQRAASEQSRLARRVKELVDKAARGGDVGGSLGPLEIECATFERDLIVTAARRRESAGLVERARRRRVELETEESMLRDLAMRCVATVTPAPRYAVPDVDALGRVPNTPDTLTSYLRRLDQVERAIQLAHAAYAGALDDHAELTGRLEAYQVKATATGVAGVAEVRAAYDLASRTLAERPCRMALATSLVSLYATYLANQPPSGARGPGSGAP